MTRIYFFSFSVFYFLSSFFLDMESDILCETFSMDHILCGNQTNGDFQQLYAFSINNFPFYQMYMHDYDQYRFIKVLVNIISTPTERVPMDMRTKADKPTTTTTNRRTSLYLQPSINNEFFEYKDEMQHHNVNNWPIIITKLSKNHEDVPKYTCAYDMLSQRDHFTMYTFPNEMHQFTVTDFYIPNQTCCLNSWSSTDQPHIFHGGFQLFINKDVFLQYHRTVSVFATFQVKVRRRFHMDNFQSTNSFVHSVNRYNDHAITMDYTKKATKSNAFSIKPKAEIHVTKPKSKAIPNQSSPNVYKEEEEEEDEETDDENHPTQQALVDKDNTEEPDFFTMDFMSYMSPNNKNCL